ncbi:hypothetical protein C804_06018, partial [Lachnospiraceae bacterium A4]
MKPNSYHQPTYPKGKPDGEYSMSATVLFSQ